MKPTLEKPKSPMPLAKGPFIYSKVDELDGADLVSNNQCASLVQYYTKAPLSQFWRKGIDVRNNGASIKRGTAVATFDKENRYPRTKHHKHAAFYLEQSDKGVWVMDQWADDPNKPTISKRFMLFTDANDDGVYPDPSNNGAALSVIMAEP